MIRLKDIAEKAGVTVPSVSKALNNSPEISEETALLIKKVAKEMGYEARPVNKKRNYVVGVIVPEVSSHYYAQLLTSIGQALEKQGYTMLTMMTFFRPENDKSVVEQLCRYKLDGIIVSCYHPMSKQIYDIIRNSGTPVLFLEEVQQSWMPLCDADSIYINQELGVRLLLEHLVELGHENIGYLGEDNSAIRYRTLVNFLEERKLPLRSEFVKIGSERFETGGYQYAQKLLKENKLPTAVFCAYDQMAYGAMKAFGEHGLRIPEDISVVGFDNNVMDDFTHVSLTTVTNPVEEMGAVAVRILMDKIENPRTHVVQRVSLQSRLITRSSTCPPKDSAEADL